MVYDSDVSDGEATSFDQVMIEAITAGAAPEAPINLIGRSKLLHVNVTWEEPVGATNYIVFRRLDSETDFTEIAQVSEYVFVDDLPTGTVSAEYYVIAENGFGRSAPSAIVLVTVSSRTR